MVVIKKIMQPTAWSFQLGWVLFFNSCSSCLISLYLFGELSAETLFKVEIFIVSAKMIHELYYDVLHITSYSLIAHHSLFYIMAWRGLIYDNNVITQTVTTFVTHPSLVFHNASRFFYERQTRGRHVLHTIYQLLWLCAVLWRIRLAFGWLILAWELDNLALYIVPIMTLPIVDYFWTPWKVYINAIRWSLGLELIQPNH
jgi:hypothetical protein